MTSRALLMTLWVWTPLAEVWTGVDLQRRPLLAPEQLPSLTGWLRQAPRTLNPGQSGAA